MPAAHLTRTDIFLTAPSYAPMEEFRLGLAAFRFYPLPAEGGFPVLGSDSWAFIDTVLEPFSGLELCRRLRLDPRTRAGWLVLVMDEDDAELRQRALAAGADDYILGPIDRQAILDRVLANTRNAPDPYQSAPLALGPLRINPAAFRAEWDGQALSLPMKEFRLLLIMAQRANTVLARGDIQDALGHDPAELDFRTVDVWIRRLRAALHQVGAADRLRTVRGVGYVLELP